MKQRLDQLVVQKGLVSTRSQAESYIRLGNVRVNGTVIKKPGSFTDQNADISVDVAQQYVSRAALKLASVAEIFELDFQDKVVLDVGSSTGGFTQFALLGGAQKIIAVDVGTNQLHPSLRQDHRIELHEQTDIRNFVNDSALNIDIVLMDVSFISLREILPHISELISPNTMVVAMVKPQFEVGNSASKHKGVIKNEKMRREILQDFEEYVRGNFKILKKSDSSVSGEKGNTERFYLLRRLK